MFSLFFEHCILGQDYYQFIMTRPLERRPLTISFNSTGKNGIAIIMPMSKMFLYKYSFLFKIILYIFVMQREGNPLCSSIVFMYFSQTVKPNCSVEYPESEETCHNISYIP